MKYLQFFLYLVCGCIVHGCSAPSADVTGIVTTEGNPVTGGSIILSPIDKGGTGEPGRPGMADIASDGTFSMHLDAGAGGLCNRWAVRFTSPNLPPMPEDEAKAAKIPYLGFLPRDSEIEVHPGQNEITIELIPPEEK